MWVQNLAARGKVRLWLENAHCFFFNCRIAAMLPKATSQGPHSEETREARRQRLWALLQAQAAPLLEQMVDTLVDAPDGELFRSVELRARDLGQQLAAATQQAGLDDRKKGAT
jgi:hypothetical protein